MHKPRIAAGLGVIALAGAAWLGAQNPPERYLGYTPQGTAAQKAIEEKFRAIPSPAEARKWHRYFTAEPHPAGSKRNNELARYIAEQWRAQGWEDVKVHQYDVLSSTPREVLLEMTAPRAHRFTLREDAYDVDPDTRNPAVQTGYLGFSASGDVTAPVVYAFSGNPEDYAYLRKQGIDPRGKIAIVRYSNPYSYRGFKALTAQREGAAGLIIYSDPMEDGFAKGKVFPDGPWGPESHIQRGAITYDFIVPGDPLTPGWASLPGAKRIPMEEAQSVPRVMAAPMSWREAKMIFEAMDGPEAPKNWQGAIPVKYRLTGTALRLRMKVDMDTRVMPNLVVEARIRGQELPDEWVVMGNHRDAWEYGGVDPSSGTASMMELTRALGELKAQGIRPQRTLVVCSWDGEEYALTGSTEWGENFADELKRKAVAYLNVDSSTSGPNFNPSAVASLAPVLEEVSRSVTAPTGRPLWEDLRAQRAEQGKQRGGAAPDLVDTRIGSGSDHTVFLNHLGVPTVGLDFDGPYGVYHSVYDNFYWMDKIGDPGYRYHTTMTQMWGSLALRLANADALPFDFSRYAEKVREFTRDLQQAGAVTDEQVDLRPLLRATVEMQTAGRALKHHVEEETLRHGSLPAAQSAELNRAALAFERNWLNPDGIPGRPWFKHLLYAARYTYAHLELPGLTEAVEGRDWKRAAEQAGLLEAAVRRNTTLLKDALAALQHPPPAAAAPAPKRTLAALENELRGVQQKLAGEMAIYMKNLSTGEEVALDADRVYETFSVIKVPIMAEVFRQAEAGKLSLNDRIELKTSHARWPSGVLYTLQPGLNPTIHDLLTLMIIISDNAATDILGDKAGRNNVTQFMRELGLKNTTIEFSDFDWDRVWLGHLDPRFRTETPEGVMSFPFDRFSGKQVSEAFRKAIYDSGIYFGHSTAREMGRVFELMQKGQLVSPRASELMLAILRKQQVNDRFPKYLGDIEVAHKTGDGQPYIANDAGILWVQDQPVVLVVFTGRHRGSKAELHEAVARVAAYVARHYGGAISPGFKD